VVDPVGRETVFTYDACGRLSSRTDPRGVTLTLLYSSAGLLVLNRSTPRGTGYLHPDANTLKDVAKRVSEPLRTVSTVATGAAAVMAGITAICPLPCGPITGAAAAVFEGVATAAKVTVLATGTVSTVPECVGSGLTSFGCMASAASTAVSTVFVSGLKVGRVPTRPSRGLLYD
jgi:YD repeat-containing protein